jgi:alpha-beta hydrolase superfamily lysophospholipase
MRHQETTLIGHRGVRLFCQRWDPEEEPLGAVVVAHGYAEHSDRYHHVAETLTSAGWAVLALDHRGHGRSQGRRAVTDRLGWLLDDLDLVVDRATGVPAGARPVLLGHSMGGGLAAAYAISYPGKLSALVLSGPALGMAATMSAPQRLAVKALSAVAPGLGTVKLDAGAVSRDPAVVAAYESDPMVYRGKVPARTAREMLRASDLVAERAGELELPLLIVAGSEDSLVPLEGSRRLERHAGSGDKTLTVYDGLYHEVFNEPEGDKVLADVVAWLDDHVARP